MADNQHDLINPIKTARCSAYLPQTFVLSSHINNGCNIIYFLQELHLDLHQNIDILNERHEDEEHAGEDPDNNCGDSRVISGSAVDDAGEDADNDEEQGDKDGGSAREGWIHEVAAPGGHHEHRCGKVVHYQHLGVLALHCHSESIYKI